MGDSAGECAKRFQFTRRESLAFDLLAFGHVAKKDRYAVVTWISVNFEPLLSVLIGRLKFQSQLLGHDPAVIRFKDRTDQFGKLLPQVMPEELVPRPMEHHFRFRVDESEFPFGIDREESVCRGLKKIRHRPRGFLQRCPRVIALIQVTDLPFSHGKTHIQKTEIKRFCQVVVRARFQCLLQVGCVSASCHEENEHLVSAGSRPQFSTEFDPAFSGKHPIENQKRKRLLSERGFGFLGATDGHDGVTAPFNQALEVLAADRVIFNEQNFHERRSQTEQPPGFDPKRASHSAGSEECHSHSWSRITAKRARFLATNFLQGRSSRPMRLRKPRVTS